MLHNPIEKQTENEAYGKPYADIAKVVHTEVESGEGCGERPENEGDSDLRTAEKTGEEDGYAHGVAGMAGEKAILPATVVTDNVDEIHEVWVLGGTPPCHCGLDDARADAVCHNDEQGDGNIYHQCLFPVVVFEDDDE